VNSSDPNAFSQGGAQIQTDSLDVVGGYSGGGISGGTVHTGVQPEPDPFRTFPVPKACDYPVRSTSPLTLSGGTTTLQPGVYQGGIQISGQAEVILGPGVYVLDGGGLQVAGQANLKGDGVLFYNTGSPAGGIDLSGQGTVSLTPPTSGPYQGMTLFQDRGATETVKITGNGSLNVTGVVYAPAAEVFLAGNGVGNTAGGGFVCNTMRLTGNGSFNVDPGSNRPKVPQVGLVE
jgi:hypothetical protein